MKTPINSITTKLGCSSQINVLTLATVLIGASATCHAQSFWTGGTSDFNVAGSWNPTGVPTGNAANDSGLGNVVLIHPGDPVWGHGDTLAGQGSGAAGSYLQTGSTNNTGYPSGGSWLRLGIGTGGTAGYYTLSNGVVNVAGQTHLGENGTGTLEVDGGTYNTGYNGNPGICAGDGDFGPSSGTLILTGGTINNINNETWFGEANSACTGYLVMSGGILNVNNWFVFGRNGGIGYGTMTGGTINFTGGGQFLIGGGGVGALAQSGGIINVQNQYLVPQGGVTGTNILSGTAVVNAHDWIAVGRNGGHGEMDISGSASITRDNNNDSGANFDVGASGLGVVNQNGGAVTNLAGQTLLGESSTGIWNLNSGVANMGSVVIAKNGNASGTLNLNGGQFAASGINSTSTGTSILNFNGGTLQASAANVNFMSGLSAVLMGSGGLVFDSQGFTVTVPQEVDDNGGGSLTKIGSGTLNLTGPNTYAGSTIVNAGVLGTTTASVGGGAYTVANGATLDVQVVGGLNSQLNVPSLTFSSSATSLGIDVNNFGTPSSAPISVSGVLTVAGTLTINVADENPQVAQFPLISYGSKTGTSYVLGTLPVGVIGHLVDNTANKSIDLDITSVNLPRWNGNVNGNWDINLTQNWINSGTGLPTTFQQGNTVTFDDNATGTTTINLAASVDPSAINFNNNSLPYTLVGTGQISGSTGLKVNGSGTVAIQNTGGNNFTGPVTIAAGILSVTNLANGGSPSPIGASSSSPTNLVISDGAFSYGGAPVTVNRGFTVEGTNATIDAEGNLTLGGNVTAVGNLTDGGSAFTKVGPAQLDLTGPGDNEFSLNYPVGVSVVAGTLMIDGSAGNQTNHTQNQLYVGDTTATGAALILTNANLSVDSWLALGRINGDINNTSSITLYNSALHCGNLSLGWDGGLPNNLSSQFLTLNGNSSLTNYGAVNLAEGANSTFTLALNGNSVFWIQNPFYAAPANSATGTVVVANSGQIVQVNGWFDIAAGANSVASLTAENNASLSLDGDLNLTDTGSGATGTLTVQDNATVQANTLWVGKSSGSVCTANIAGSGAINLNNYIVTANGSGSIGNINISGGSLTAGTDMTIGQAGTSVVNMVSNSGALLTVHGTMYLSRGSQVADGTVNLNPGTTIVAGYVNNGWGFQNNFPSPTNNPNAFNFNGGTLKAYVGSPYFIQPYVNAVVQSGGAIINDGGFNITVLAPLVNGGGGGGLTKLGNGTLILAGTNTYTGPTLVSRGSLGCSASIAGPVTVASGATLLGDTGTIGTFAINNTLTLAAGSTANFNVTPSSNDQIQGLTGVNYGGSLVVNNTSATPLTVGSVFQLFNASSPGSGNFSSITLLPVGTATFNPATGQLTVTSSAPPNINPPILSGGNLILTGTGGSPGAGYTLLTTTNLASGWTTNLQSTFSGTGTFSNNIPVNISQPAEFFKLRTP